MRHLHFVWLSRFVLGMGFRASGYLFSKDACYDSAAITCLPVCGPFEHLWLHMNCLCFALSSPTSAEPDNWRKSDPAGVRGQLISKTDKNVFLSVPTVFFRTVHFVYNCIHVSKKKMLCYCLAVFAVVFIVIGKGRHGIILLYFFLGWDHGLHPHKHPSLPVTNRLQKNLKRFSSPLLLLSSCWNNF